MSMRAALKSLLLVVATFAFQPVSAQETTRKIVTTQNGDYFGFDLRTEQNVSQPQCETICINDASCKAFTYNPKVKWCFLKSDFNQLNAFPGAVAGKVVEVASEPDIGAPQKLSFVDDSLYQQARRLTLDLPAAGDGQQVDDLLAAARQQSAVGNDALAAHLRGPHFRSSMVTGSTSV